MSYLSEWIHLTFDRHQHYLKNQRLYYPYRNMSNQLELNQLKHYFDFERKIFSKENRAKQDLIIVKF